MIEVNLFSVATLGHLARSRLYSFKNIWLNTNTCEQFKAANLNHIVGFIREDGKWKFAGF